MGLPSINIVFRTAAVEAIQRSAHGIAALILKETNYTGDDKLIEILSVAEIPKKLSAENKEQIELAFIGYQNVPKKIMAYILDDGEDIAEAQRVLESVKWNYIAFPEITDAEVASFAPWIKSLRDNLNKRVKAILPNCKADHEGIINFTSEKITTKTKEYTAAQYCARIAGMLAGTPFTISATFAPLPEVISCKKLTREELDEAIDSGELVIFNDGEKCKIARAVNSFVTTTADKGEDFKKIKIVDIADMINENISKTAEDSYLGKYPNDYDNKCLLISAIQGYFDILELETLLDKGKSKIGIDISAQKAYLKSIGTDISLLTEQQIKEYNTKDKVFLEASIKILDAIEDISLKVSL